MFLSEEQFERYARNITVEEVGNRGQEQLLNAKVLIIGAGGLGCPAAVYLAAAGVGTLGIADSDLVELSNLQRQFLHTAADVGKAKTLSAQEAIRRFNPDVSIHTYHKKVTAENIMQMIQEYDFVIDAVDNAAAKFLINDACVLGKKPFSHAGVIRFQGQLMTYVPGQGPCCRCVFQDPPSRDAVQDARAAGIIGAAAGVIGSLQAMEAVKYILGIGELLTGYLLTCDTLTMNFRKVKLPRHVPECIVCGEYPVITSLAEDTYRCI